MCVSVCVCVCVSLFVLDSRVMLGCVSADHTLLFVFHYPENEKDFTSSLIGTRGTSEVSHSFMSLFKPPETQETSGQETV